MIRRRTTAGFSIVEVTIAMAIGVTLLLIATQLTTETTRLSSSAFVRSSVFVRASKAADLVVKDLQTSSFLGEDRNGNGTLDTGEDSNGNGVLDAAWNLADGTSAATLTFNNLQSGWTWTSAITYTVQNGTLVRLEGANTREICRGIEQFAVTRSGGEIAIALRSSGRDSAGRTWAETAERRLYVRN